MYKTNWRCAALATLTVVGTLISSALAAPVLAAPVAGEMNSASPKAIGFDGGVDLSTVQVENGHVYDYTFSTAPVDWKVQSGVWEMTNRWDCSPGWSWYGGRSEEVAAIWNKRKFSGDFSAQFYFAFKMDFVKTPKWHYHPQNVAISFCGDGKNFGSGYSFIVGADNNERSALYKKGKSVMDSNAPEALLFSLADGYPPLEQLHRRWWYVKVNKIGPRIECWLDNKLLFTYNDPKPLDVGQMALWTYNNGIMLSRVQIFYENEVKPDIKSLRVRTPAKSALPAKVASVNPVTSKGTSQ